MLSLTKKSWNKLTDVLSFYSMMNAFSEGLELADSSGLDPHTLLDVLVRSLCDIFFSLLVWIESKTIFF